MSVKHKLTTDGAVQLPLACDACGQFTDLEGLFDVAVDWWSGDPQEWNIVCQDCYLADPEEEQTA